MSMIKCPECGKEISDKASICPNCGYPLDSPSKVGNNTTPASSLQPASPNKKKKHGCLTVIAAFLVFSAVIGLMASKSPQSALREDSKEGIAKYIDVDAEKAKSIDTVLASVGIEHIDDATHDELLDNAHFDGEIGYRLTTGEIDNVILYLDQDMSVSQIRYADKDLFADGNVIWQLQDQVLTVSEFSTYQVLCQDKIKEILKAPSSAEFPGMSEWGAQKIDGIITLQAYVDSQNSFGAMIRSDFQFIIDSKSNTIQSLIFDGQELITQQ